MYYYPSAVLIKEGEEISLSMQYTDNEDAVVYQLYLLYEQLKEEKEFELFVKKYNPESKIEESHIGSRGKYEITPEIQSYIDKFKDSESYPEFRVFLDFCKETKLKEVFFISLFYEKDDVEYTKHFDFAESQDVIFFELSQFVKKNNLENYTMDISEAMVDFEDLESGHFLAIEHITTHDDYGNMVKETPYVILANEEVEEIKGTEEENIFEILQPINLVVFDDIKQKEFETFIEEESEEFFNSFSKIESEEQFQFFLQELKEYYSEGQWKYLLQFVEQIHNRKDLILTFTEHNTQKAAMFGEDNIQFMTHYLHNALINQHEEAFTIAVRQITNLTNMEGISEKRVAFFNASAFDIFHVPKEEALAVSTHDHFTGEKIEKEQGVRYIDTEKMFKILGINFN